ncbi:hypothetical protein MZK49_00660 [Ensifer sesbaniae]|uniref:hypothetical protein n=1 Tax=Ensifer sesbaniae TaxID=1214071 RepID=UPI00200063C5|nr:hypothetical protein [Ensifer sesbaniae]
MKRDELLRNIIFHYLGSDDFNGWVLPTDADAGLRNEVAGLVRDRLIDVISSQDDDNPHIKRYKPPPAKLQLRRLMSDYISFRVCLYPTAEALQVHGVRFDEREPYTSAVRQGEPQNSFRAFPLSMLEEYDRNPDYECWIFEDGGTIWYRGVDAEACDFEFAPSIEEETFLLVYLRRLAALSPSQQRNWSRFETTEFRPREYAQPDLFDPET